MDIAPHLTAGELDVELSKRPGLIPVAIANDSAQILWLDLDAYHAHEGFFHQSIAAYTALCKTTPRRFFTAFDVLGSIRVPDTLRPTGFIFHAGRCGSTLLVKILARSRGNLVFSEAAPHNQIWRALPPDRAARLATYRNLITAMGRRRLESYRAHIVKFTSFNIMQIESIRAAFPGVPALFLFRDPAAAMDSFARNPPGWLGRDVGFGQPWRQMEPALEGFLRAASLTIDRNFRCLDYSSLSPEFLPSILDFLGVRPTAQEFRAMLSEFHRDAKSGLPRSLEPAGAVPGSPVSGVLRSLYRQLIGRVRADWAE